MESDIHLLHKEVVGLRGMVAAMPVPGSVHDGGDDIREDLLHEWQVKSAERDANLADELRSYTAAIDVALATLRSDMEGGLGKAAQCMQEFSEALNEHKGTHASQEDMVRHCLDEAKAFSRHSVRSHDQKLQDLYGTIQDHVSKLQDHASQTADILKRTNTLENRLGKREVAASKEADSIQALLAGLSAIRTGVAKDSEKSSERFKRNENISNKLEVKIKDANISISSLLEQKTKHESVTAKEFDMAKKELVVLADAYSNADARLHSLEAAALAVPVNVMDDLKECYATTDARTLSLLCKFHDLEEGMALHAPLHDKIAALGDGMAHYTGRLDALWRELHILQEQGNSCKTDNLENLQVHEEDPFPWCQRCLVRHPWGEHLYEPNWCKACGMNHPLGKHMKYAKSWKPHKAYSKHEVPPPFSSPSTSSTAEDS